MRTGKLLTVALISLGLALAQPPAPKPPARKAAPAKSYKDLKYPPLNEIKVPEPVRFELANGMVVYLVEDHETPMISVSWWCTWSRTTKRP